VIAPEEVPGGPSFRSRIDRPIFIVSTPRSGSTLLFETIKQAPGLYTVGGESHWLIEDIAGLAPSERGWSSNRLTAADAGPETVEALSRAFHEEIRLGSDGHLERGDAGIDGCGKAHDAAAILDLQSIHRAVVILDGTGAQDPVAVIGNLSQRSRGHEARRGACFERRGQT
jgi:hypothetical protein